MNPNESPSESSGASELEKAVEVVERTIAAKAYHMLEGSPGNPFYDVRWDYLKSLLSAAKRTQSLEQLTEKLTQTLHFDLAALRELVGFAHRNNFRRVSPSDT